VVERGEAPEGLALDFDAIIDASPEFGARPRVAADTACVPAK
jgi:hypothetical protein